MTPTLDFFTLYWRELLILFGLGLGLSLWILSLLNAHRERMNWRQYIRDRTGKWPD